MKFALLLLLISVLSCVAADVPTQSQLLAIDSAFVEGEYAQVELLVLRLTQGDAGLTPQERARVNLTAGYALIMLDREPEARDYFRHALEADPTLTLDPVQVSPKFRMVFDEVKAAYSPLVPDPGAPVLDAARRPPAQSAMLSNLFLPGSGQWRDGRRVRGAALLLAQAASIGLLIWQTGELRQSREEYLAQTDPARIRAAYDEYDRDHSLTWGAGVLAAAVYVAAQADLILFRPEESPLEVQASGPGEFRAGLRVRW